MASTSRLPDNPGGVPSLAWLTARARARGASQDAADVAAEVMLRLLEKCAAGGMCTDALASKMVRDEIATRRRRAQRDAGQGSARAAGRPRGERYRDPEQLRTAVLDALSHEFRMTWGVGAAEVLPGPLAEVEAYSDRRSWLAFALDHSLGDVCPWAVDDAGRTPGARRVTKPRGVLPAPPDPPHPLAAARAAFRAAHGRDMSVSEIIALTSSEEHQRREIEHSWLRRPGRDEALTDREMAIVSILVGNWPDLASRTRGDGRLRQAMQVGDVLTLEIEAMQSARRRHGVLDTAEKKSAVHIAPKSRRKRAKPER